MAEDLRQLARNFLLLSNIFNLVKIDKLVVPDLVEMTTSDIVLDCQFTVPDDNFTLQWYLNNQLVYEWRPLTVPKVGAVLNGRLDLTYRCSNKSSEERRALRIIGLSPELNGNYTCTVASHSGIAHQSKNMLIYSPEREFDLMTKFNDDVGLEVSCTARGIYPRPDLTIEYNNATVSGQWQRVRRSDLVDSSWLYDAVCHALIKHSVNNTAVVVCRLNLPEADYTAIKKKIIMPDREVSDCWRNEYHNRTDYNIYGYFDLVYYKYLVYSKYTYKYNNVEYLIYENLNEYTIPTITRISIRRHLFYLPPI